MYRRTREAFADTARDDNVLASLRANHVSLKLRDAQQLMEALVRTPDRRFKPDFDWTFHATDFWKAEFPG